MSNVTSTSIATSLRRLERGRLFQGSVIFIIILSALSIGAKTYELSPLTERVINTLDSAITVFFLVEILFRYAACEDRRRFFLNGWNLFDSIIVLGSLVPLESAESLLLGRLLRVFRVLRLVSVVPELRSLINALLIAIPRMGYIALLMFVIFYIYAAVGSIFFGPIDEVLWGDVSVSMLTLFRVATFEDWTDVMYATMAVYPISWLYFLTFIFLTAFIFLNMMVGTILEVMTAEHNADTANKAHEEREELAERLVSIQSQLQAIQTRLERDRTP